VVLLETRGLTKRFGGLTAVNAVDLSVEPGEVRALIGPNGAGKSTIFNVITGVYKPTNGKIFFKGEDITGKSPNAIATRGLVRTFQANVLFGTLTVFDNIAVGSYLARKKGFLQNLFCTASTRQDNNEINKKATELMEFLGLDHVKDEVAMSLPHGYQRLLGVAVAIACEPELLLLDEPVTGMTPTESDSMIGLLMTVRREHKVAILIIEHNMRAVMTIADRITVINFGEKIAEGLPKEIRENPKVIKAYLGSGEGL